MLSSLLNHQLYFDFKPILNIESQTLKVGDTE